MLNYNLMKKHKEPRYHTVTLDVIVGGGQSLGTLEDGRKLFTWGGLPDETVKVRETKRKSSYIESVVEEVLKASPDRIEPREPNSYLSTSPWQHMTYETEQRYKAALIEEAFELHDIVLPFPIEVYSDGVAYGYRNKIEFSFWYDTETESLSLAFFRRGTHGKISIDGTELALPGINKAGQAVLGVLNKHKLTGRSLKTLLVRATAEGAVCWQLYVKETDIDWQSMLPEFIHAFPEATGEIIFSNPQSPASVITERLCQSGDTSLTDTLLNIPFRYATEGFFQINLPIYEQALKDMQEWIPEGHPVVDMYSGVGTIGLTIGGPDVTLVEMNEHAVREMRENIEQLKSSAKAVLSASEQALEYIQSDQTVIVDPPRAGLHQEVVDRLLEQKPPRIIYLSCNPVTQARDVALLSQAYGIKAHKGYNFFPRTPHIENLVVLDLL